MVILGGAGSQAGVVLGAVVIERHARGCCASPSDARGLFYVVIVLGARRGVPRLALKLAVVLGGTVVFGSSRAIVAARDRRRLDRRRGRGGRRPGALGGGLGDRARRSAEWVRPVSYISLVALVLAAHARAWLGGGSRCSSRRSTSRAFVWENVMLAEPGVDAVHRARRDPVALMIARPQGLLGEKRVEIV